MNRQVNYSRCVSDLQNAMIFDIDEIDKKSIKRLIKKITPKIMYDENINISYLQFIDVSRDGEGFIRRALYNIITRYYFLKSNNLEKDIIIKNEFNNLDIPLDLYKAASEYMRLKNNSHTPYNITQELNEVIKLNLIILFREQKKEFINKYLIPTL